MWGVLHIMETIEMAEWRPAGAGTNCEKRRRSKRQEDTKARMHDIRRNS
jgi:hypothetical protein